ncbi:hypothetical protein PB2503_09019 [Parvularcula bermudensis HTCC2503]|uniref:Protein translocase subunit SecE n=1 Tax=Parvularcula bermudensis (strain ATCC BAA-594 / HTCC2503 / KCTC 12087) TaxID=314260 RepID=E0TCR8_PARBH|nr:preprotein translocase subunit SecE [Parvularcula bermudensis]ADM09857.1 hypothetical protein PB2503_09019 [Parvularcula bermudensis HTCC2503]
MPKSKNRRKPKRSQGSAPASPGRPDAGASSAATAKSVQGDAKEASPAAKKVGPIQFFRQVRDEALKVTWTSRNETLVSTIMVLIMVALASMFFLLVDTVLRWIVPIILSVSV